MHPILAWTPCCYLAILLALGLTLGVEPLLAKAALLGILMRPVNKGPTCLSSERLRERVGARMDAPCQRPGAISSSGSSGSLQQRADPTQPHVKYTYRATQDDLAH